MIQVPMTNLAKNKKECMLEKIEAEELVVHRDQRIVYGRKPSSLQVSPRKLAVSCWLIVVENFLFSHGLVQAMVFQTFHIILPKSTLPETDPFPIAEATAIT
jgi:hypothetical protein